jgi:hypothetical protein
VRAVRFIISPKFHLVGMARTQDPRDTTPAGRSTVPDRLGRQKSKKARSRSSMSASDTPYRLQTGRATATATATAGNNARTTTTDDVGASSSSSSALPFCTTIDDFHPLNFKRLLNPQTQAQAQTSVQSSGPGFEFTGPPIVQKKKRNDGDDDNASDTSSSSSIGVGWYMTQQERQRLRNNQQLSAKDKRIVQYLAMRKFHIPGNAFWEDYFYWCVLPFP